MATTLDRDDILDGLRALIADHRSSNLVVGIRLVGRAALALRYFPCGTTQDLDSLHIRRAATPTSPQPRRGSLLREDGIPRGSTSTLSSPGWRDPVLWETRGRMETIFDGDGILIEVAAKEAMLWP